VRTILAKKGWNVDGACQQTLDSKTNHDGDTVSLAQKNTLFHQNPALEGVVIDGTLRTSLGPTPPSASASAPPPEFVSLAATDASRSSALRSRDASLRPAPSPSPTAPPPAIRRARHEPGDAETRGLRAPRTTSFTLRWSSPIDSQLDAFFALLYDFARL
jgi:hypothetical protein